MHSITHSSCTRQHAQRNNGFINLPTNTHSLAADRNGRHEHEDAHQTDTIIVKWSHKYTQQNKHRNKIIIMKQKMYCCNGQYRTVITHKNASMWITKCMETYTLMHTCSVANKSMHTHTHTHMLAERCLWTDTSTHTSAQPCRSVPRRR